MGLRGFSVASLFFALAAGAAAQPHAAGGPPPLTAAWNFSEQAQGTTFGRSLLSVLPDGRVAYLTQRNQSNMADWLLVRKNKDGTETSRKTLPWPSLYSNCLALDLHNNVTIAAGGTYLYITHSSLNASTDWTHSYTPRANCTPLAIAIDPANNDITVAVQEQTAQNAYKLTFVRYTEAGNLIGVTSDTDISPTTVTTGPTGYLYAVGGDNISQGTMGGSRAAVYNAVASRTWTDAAGADSVYKYTYMVSDGGSSTDGLFALNYVPAGSVNVSQSYVLFKVVGNAAVYGNFYPGNVKWLGQGAISWAHVLNGSSGFLNGHGSDCNQTFSHPWHGQQPAAGQKGLYYLDQAGSQLNLYALDNSGQLRGNIQAFSSFYPPLIDGLALSSTGAHLLLHTQPDFTTQSNILICEKFVDGLALSSVSCAPNPVIGGNNVTLTGHLNGTTPSPMPLRFELGNAATTASIASGGTATSVALPTLGVDHDNYPLYATATDPEGVTPRVVVYINTASLSAITSPSSLYGGNGSYGTVWLNGKAGPSGTVVNLSASPSSLVSGVPTSVTVPSQAKAKSFSFTAAPVDTAATVTFTATRNGATKTANTTILPAKLASFTCESSVVGGKALHALLRLNGKRPSPYAVHLYSSSAIVVPFDTTVYIPANALSFSLPVGTNGVDAPTSVTLSADSGTIHLTRTVTINNTALYTFLLSSTSAQPATNITGKVFLNGNAGPAGVPVTVTYSSTSVVGPSSLTIPAQHSYVYFNIAVKSTATPATVTVTVKVGAAQQSKSFNILQ